MKDIDFLPDRIRAQRARRRRLSVQGYLLAVCILGLVGLGFVFEARVARARDELNILSSRSGGVEH